MSTSAAITRSKIVSQLMSDALGVSWPPTLAAIRLRQGWGIHFCAATHGPLDQAMRETQSRSKFLLTPRHLARVDFVIVAGEMKQPMKDEDLDFNRKRMSALLSLPTRGWNADGKIAGNLQRPLRRGKRKHVGRFVLAAELPIQSPNSCVGGQQYGHLAAQLHGCLRLAQKTSEGAGRTECVDCGAETARAEPVSRLGTVTCRETSASRSGSRRIIVREAAACSDPVSSSILREQPIAIAVSPGAQPAAAPAALRVARSPRPGSAAVPAAAAWRPRRHARCAAPAHAAPRPQSAKWQK